MLVYRQLQNLGSAAWYQLGLAEFEHNCNVIGVPREVDEVLKLINISLDVSPAWRYHSDSNCISTVVASFSRQNIDTNSMVKSPQDAKHIFPVFIPCLTMCLVKITACPLLRYECCKWDVELTGCEECSSMHLISVKVVGDTQFNPQGVRDTWDGGYRW
jgi:hypothetical protein